MHDRFTRRGFTAALATAGAGLLLPLRARADDLALRARLVPRRQGGRVWLSLYVRHTLAEAVVLPAEAIELTARFDGGRVTLRAPERPPLPMLRSGERHARLVSVPAGRQALYDRFGAPASLELPAHGRLVVRAALRPGVRASPESEALARIAGALPLPLFEDESLPPTTAAGRMILRGGPRRR